MTDDARTARLRMLRDDVYQAAVRLLAGDESFGAPAARLKNYDAALDAYADAYAAEMRREGALTTLRKLEPECWCASGLHQCAIHHLLSEAERGEAP